MSARVLIATHEFPPQVGGVARFCHELAQALTRLAIVDVVAPAYEALADAVANPDLPFNLLRFPGAAFRHRNYFVYRAAIRARLQAHSYDRVIAADWPALLALRTLDTGSAKRCWVVYGSEIKGLAESLLSRYALKSRAAIASLDDIICISEFTRQRLLHHFPSLRNRARVVPLGVSEDWFRSVDEAAVRQFRARHGGDAGHKLVLTVARLDRRKGQDRMIRAIAALPAAERDRLVYLCVGPNSEPDYATGLLELAAEIGVRCRLLGRLSDDEVRVAYRAADLFALTANPHPVKYEGFGLVLLESAAQGLPSLVTAVDAIPEVVEHGVTGLICDADADISTGLLQLLSGRLQITRTDCIGHARGYSWAACAGRIYGTDSAVSGLPLALTGEDR